MKSSKAFSARRLLFTIPIPVILGIVSAGCSENAERVSARETAEQIQEAGLAGRDAARHIMIREITDTMELMNMLLEARAKSSQYEMEGRMKEKAAFDTAFISTIRTVKPDLATAIEQKNLEE